MESKKKETNKIEESKAKKQENLFVLIMVFITVVSICMNTFVFQFANVVGDSMFPTLNNSEKLVVSKLSRFTNNYDRGDIVIFKHDGRFLIKRVIGLPNETVQIKDNDIYINGNKINDYVDVQMEKYGVLESEIQLKEDEYICLGDNRNNSLDCREIGAINESQIAGKIVIRIKPWTKF